MYKYIVLCLCVSLSGLLCNLNKEEGAACVWEGAKGRCVKEKHCLTTLDKRSGPHLVCTVKGDVTIVCCTDCKFINDTRNVVFSPTVGIYFKHGTKARDNCLEYHKTLKRDCDGYYSGIRKRYDKERKCHTVDLWGVGGSPPGNSQSGAKYPHQALLGYGEDLATAAWLTGGSIISNKYILTAAQVGSIPTQGPVKFVAVGVMKRSDGPNAWQIHIVKRVITHPDYKAPKMYNDIALIELEETISYDQISRFGGSLVLPACLHVTAAKDDTAIATSWKDLTSTSRPKYADTMQTIDLEKFSEEECKTAYSSTRTLPDGINYNTQMCYGSKSQDPNACKGFVGEPLLISTQFSRCVYTIIGVTSFGHSRCGGTPPVPDVFTRVAHYIPWIESVVWAE